MRDAQRRDKTDSHSVEAFQRSTYHVTESPMSILPPLLLGALGIVFFFTIIGVFGLWFAIEGLGAAIAISVYIFAKRPEQEQQ